MWVYQRAIKLSHRASEIMYETMAVSLFTRNGALKTRYFAARKLTYRTRSLIYAKDCKDLFLSPTLIIVIAWVETPPPPSQIPLPSDFCWGEGVCAQTTLLYVLSRSIKETRTKTLHYNNLKMCVKKKKDKNYLFEDSFFFLSQGYLEYSFLFYGYYGNEYIHVGAVKYPLPLAYFVVFMGTYLFSIIIVLRA